MQRPEMQKTNKEKAVFRRWNREESAFRRWLHRELPAYLKAAHRRSEASAKGPLTKH